MGFFARKTTIAKLREGVVATIRGTVKAGSQSVIAPLSQRAVPYYLVRVEGTSPLFQEGSGAPFLLSDTTGTIVIDPAGAAVDFRHSHAAFFTENNPAAVAFERSRNYVRWKSWVSSDLGVFAEWTVLDGVELEVTAAPISIAEPTETGYRDVKSTLMLRHSEHAPMLIRWR